MTASTRDRLAALLVVALVALLGSACTGGTDRDDRTDAGPAAGTATATATGTTAPATPLPTATPVPPPVEGACYALTQQQAVAPTTDVPSVDCAQPHTAVTFAVGVLDTVVGGHLVAVDSERVRTQVAAECPSRLRSFLGGSRDEQRLSMLRAVWFTPTVAESDAGADWFRCDVVAPVGADTLAPLTGRLAGVLDRPEGERYAMCGTAAPDDPRFERVLCSEEHTWRAVAVVDLPAGDYPGVDVVRSRGQEPCEGAGRSAAEDPLDFQWGYEWPTAEQWAAGQTYGRCWAPD